MNLLVYSKTFKLFLSCILYFKNASGRLKNCGLHRCSEMKSIYHKRIKIAYTLVKYRV